MGRIQTVQEHQNGAFLALERYKWPNILLTVYGIILSAFVFFGIGGMYFSLDKKLERLSGVEHRQSGVEHRLLVLEQEMSAGFAELKSMILNLQKNVELSGRSNH